jgi:hypothetical protein
VVSAVASLALDEAGIVPRFSQGGRHFGPWCAEVTKVR